jgi:hypothetical protein
VRFEYNVLSVEVDRVIDTLAIHAAYVAGGHDGVYLRVARSARLRDLEFLRDLPGLRYVEVLGSVVDDTVALLIPGVREVCLLTRCKKALPDLSGSTVSRIGLDSRPRLEQVAAVGLDEFSVWGWRGTDFLFLGDQPGLRRLKVEAARQLVSLEVCSAVHGWSASSCSPCGRRAWPPWLQQASFSTCGSSAIRASPARPRWI